jgi:hypothetical protein
VLFDISETASNKGAIPMRKHLVSKKARHQRRIEYLKQVAWMLGFFFAIPLTLGVTMMLSMQ